MYERYEIVGTVVLKAIRGGFRPQSFPQIISKHTRVCTVCFRENFLHSDDGTKYICEYFVRTSNTRLIVRVSETKIIIKKKKN